MTVPVRADQILVAEMFGPTFQGEGPRAGQQALFVRLSRCNLSCPACDTPYTWDASRFVLSAHTSRHSAASILEWVLDRAPNLVVVTGGEPLLQQARLLPLIAGVVKAGRIVEIETNGTVVPTTGLLDLVTNFNVSPKLSGFAAPHDDHIRVNPAALDVLARSGKAVFKFVVSGPADLAEIAELQQRFGLKPVWVMPEAVDSTTLASRLHDLADEVLVRGWNLSNRLHIQIWEDTRAR